MVVCHGRLKIFMPVDLRFEAEKVGKLKEIKLQSIPISISLEWQLPRPA